MWLTVLVLALAINLEPARPTWVPIMLTRPRPMLQLWAFFCGNVISGLVAGLLLLFVFHQTIGGQDKLTGIKIQIILGVLMIVAAILLALSGLRRRRLPAAKAVGDSVSPPERADTSSGAFERFAAPAMSFLAKGNSPWLSAIIGVGTGLPSVDYLAALVVIGSSGAKPTAQVGALVMFLVVGNAVAAFPLLTYLAAPDATLSRIEGFRIWVQSRTREQFAVGIAAVGVLQVVIGWARL